MNPTKATIMFATQVLATLLIGANTSIVSAQTQTPSAGQLSSVGFAVNTECEVGTCPPSTPQPMGTTLNVPLNFVVTVATGDMFQVVGTYETDNGKCPGSNASAPQFSVQYIGSADGLTSQADALGFDAYTNFACAPPTASSGAVGGPGTMLVYGRFSSDISPMSSASDVERIDEHPVAVLGPFAPPGLFSKTRQNFASITTGDVVGIHETVRVRFGAGSPIGSYVTFGGQPAPGVTPLPPGSPAPTVQVVQASDGQLHLVVGDYRWTFSPASVSLAEAQRAVAQSSGELDGMIPTDMLTTATATQVVVIYQGPNGVLILGQGSKTWVVIPSSISEEDLAALNDSGAIDGVVPADILSIATSADAAP